MLYPFDPATKELDQLEPIDAASARVTEDEIEKALAHRPECIFKSTSQGSPVLVVKKSVRGVRMADIIALDAEGSLVLVECKRGLASRDTLAQLFDYAADYFMERHARLQADWSSGEGKSTGDTLLARYRKFTDDPRVEEAAFSKGEVLVVVAAQEDERFRNQAAFLRARGVRVYFVPFKLLRNTNGDLFLDVEPIDLNSSSPAGPPDGLVSPTPADSAEAVRVWMINTDEAHSPGAYQRFIDRGVAAIWGYPDGPRTLQQGARMGDTIYAYRSGEGIVARGTVSDGEVLRATKAESVFPECTDDNEWHLRVAWASSSAGHVAITNSAVRTATGAGLPVRNTFCRLWNPNVRAFLERQRL